MFQIEGEDLTLVRILNDQGLSVIDISMALERGSIDDSDDEDDEDVYIPCFSKDETMQLVSIA